MPTVRRLVIVQFLAACAIAAAPATAAAQWTAVSLHPAGYSNSLGAGGTATQQAGSVDVGGGTLHAALWNGTSSWTDLHPAGATFSQCFAAAGSMQAGSIGVAGAEHAAVWSGTAASCVDLNPTGASFSRVWGMSSDTQVGFVANSTGLAKACMWQGSASSFVDLHPAGGTSFSIALGAGGGQQCGAVDFAGNLTMASVWTGTASSWVPLNPPGIPRAQAWATDGSTQVGRIWTTGLKEQAALWKGTAASYVDLDPPNTSSSAAFAVDGGEQVGRVNFPFQLYRASHWSGTASSWTDLHLALSNDYSSSEAFSIWHAGGRTYVFGTATNATLGRTEPILWWKLASTTYCTAKVNSLGCTPTFTMLGTPTATQSIPCFLYATNLYNLKNGTWIYGAGGRANLPFFGGTLCVASPLHYATVQSTNGSNPPKKDCTGSLGLDFPQFRDGLLGGHPAAFLKVPGTIVNCQFWARDPGFAPGTNAQLTTGLEFELGP
ncbi:MAG: hypothetical protein L6Q99_20395 [Planctomycetes bacterium]|nr:hypothetical protein [Planctomycetota bacterium]